MKIKKNGKVIRLTESDLKRIVKRVLNEGTILGSLYELAQQLSKQTPLEGGKTYFSKDPQVGNQKRSRFSKDMNKLFVQGMIQNKIVDADSPEAFYVVKEKDAEGAPQGIEPRDYYYLGGGNMNSDQMIGKTAQSAAQYIVNNLYKNVKDSIAKATEMTKKGTDPNRPR